MKNEHTGAFGPKFPNSFFLFSKCNVPPGGSVKNLSHFNVNHRGWWDTENWPFSAFSDNRKIIFYYKHATTAKFGKSLEIWKSAIFPWHHIILSWLDHLSPKYGPLGSLVELYLQKIACTHFGISVIC